ncbi:LolA family protein [Swaminathania salitolerans]|uniref:LolA family protein n=1 Tax=Swaminathania salitolerans TaxID=182838 RepID=UPI0011BFE432|nr:outer membrane lipoprotein carrier protein LolA [Swaminathania salitolerans]GBQ10669.1 outer-membrane lipoprotein carrier protein [Swaminathania salitolerans LMG 21291]
MRAQRYASGIATALLLSGCATSGLTGLTPDQKRNARRVEAYLNRPVAVVGTFEQSGTAFGEGSGRFVYRPGQIALDYIRPHPMRLRARGGHLRMEDLSNGAVTQLSLARNPLGLLLHVPVRFAGSIRVSDVSTWNGGLQVSLAEANNPSQGLLSLRFSDRGGGLQLAALDGVDARRHRVVITLHDMRDAPAASSLSGEGTGVSPK